MFKLKKKNDNKDVNNINKQTDNEEVEEKPSLKEMFGFKKKQEDGNKQRGLEIKLPDCEEYVPLGAWQYHKVYRDSLGKHLMIVVDEVAELLQAEGGRSAEAKEIAALQAEVETCIKSLTQLGRSSCISVVLATQRNDASVIPGIIQNNPLHLDTMVRVLRPVNPELLEKKQAIIDSSVSKEGYESLKEFADGFEVEYNENGIVFESEEDKSEFYSNMKRDAELYDKEGKHLTSEMQV